MDNREIDKKIATDIMKFKDLEFLGFWSPSTRPDHAFEVVDKMAKDGAELRMDCVDGNWLVWFYCNKTNKPLCAPDNKDHPKTPAMAICKAALETIKDS